MNLDYFHIFSPLLYCSFVSFSKKYFKPLNNENLYLIIFRKIHNINLSLLSFGMFYIFTIGQYQEDKFSQFNNFICKSYNNNVNSWWAANLFLWSKYLEWGDTLFLILFNKPISWLQYTHHMSTAFLMYFNMNDNLSPYLYLPIASNCLVHIPMYWYFAYPKGFLYKFRKIITYSQIIQHISVLILISYTYYNRDTCPQNYYGNIFGLALYSMYLLFFINLFISKYIKSDKNYYKLKT